MIGRSGHTFSINVEKLSELMVMMYIGLTNMSQEFSIHDLFVADAEVEYVETMLKMVRNIRVYLPTKSQAELDTILGAMVVYKKE